MAFAEQGCEVAAVCPKGHPLRRTRTIGQRFRYRATSPLRSLTRAIDTYQPDLIVPADDRAVLHLHALRALGGNTAAVVQRSLGGSDWFSALETRHAILQLAGAWGIRVPRTMRLGSAKDLDNWAEPLPWVIKSSRSWGGMGVRIVHSREEAISAYRALARPVSIAAAVKRLLVNHDGFWIEPSLERTVPEVIVQGFVAGVPANTAAACWQGDVLGMLNMQALETQGPTGAAAVVQVIENPAMTKAARCLARRMALSGFHGLDFVIADNGEPWLIEVNPRATQLCHLAIEDGESLVAALCARLLGRSAPCADPAQPGVTVALFPQAWRINPRDKRIRSAVHDVPWEEPELMKEMMKPDWPNRAWSAQIWLRLFGQDGARPHGQTLGTR